MCYVITYRLIQNIAPRLFDEFMDVVVLNFPIFYLIS